MPDQASTTVTEVAVRKILSKEDLKEILEKSGRSTGGPKEELAERVLADSTLDLKLVFGRLSEEQLRGVFRELDLPVPPKPGFLQLPPDYLLTGERGRLAEHLVKLGKKQGWAPRSRPTAPAPSRGDEGPSPTSNPVVNAPSPSLRAPEVVLPPPPVHPAPKLVVPESSFEDLCGFLDGYNFTKRWDEEILFEAELGGAISGRFQTQKVVHQMAVGGTKADIVACGAVIEIKYPKTRQPLQTLMGQVDDYQKLFGNKVVVVICTGGLRETQAYNDAAATLSTRGVKVYLK
ncbi:MAG TPA: hypothetical protein VGS23_01325 [Thermoplasmata archaeon]|nr:hypothetical protein [Thermoplasmata archaeon]